MASMMTHWGCLSPDIELTPLDDFHATFKVISQWMEEEASSEMVINTLRQVIHADMEAPVVLGAHGEILDGLAQLLRAYMEGREVVRTVYLKPRVLALQGAAAID